MPAANWRRWNGEKQKGTPQEGCPVRKRGAAQALASAGFQVRLGALVTRPFFSALAVTRT